MSKPKFKPGDNVAITEGPLCYRYGEVLEVYVYPDGDPDSRLEAPWYYILAHGWMPESWLGLNLNRKGEREMRFAKKNNDEHCPECDLKYNRWFVWPGIGEFCAPCHWNWRRHRQMREI